MILTIVMKLHVFMFCQKGCVDVINFLIDKRCIINIFIVAIVNSIVFHLSGTYGIIILQNMYLKKESILLRIIKVYWIL